LPSYVRMNSVIQDLVRIFLMNAVERQLGKAACLHFVKPGISHQASANTVQSTTSRIMPVS
jgi:hypothetical protein